MWTCLCGDYAVCHERAALLNELYVVRATVLQTQKAKVQTLAFVVLPDHVDGLFVLGDETLAVVIRLFKSCTAHWANAHLKREGRFWQAGYYDKAVRHKEDLREVARYIVANPLRAGLVNSIGDYSGWDAVWF